MINTKLLDEIINMKICPIICSLSHDKKGQILNTNADSIASEISIKYDISSTVTLPVPGNPCSLIIQTELASSCNNGLDSMQLVS